MSRAFGRKKKATALRREKFRPFIMSSDFCFDSVNRRKIENCIDKVLWKTSSERR